MDFGSSTYNDQVGTYSVLTIIIILMYGPVWSIMVSYGPVWSRVVLYIVQYGLIYGPVWSHMVHMVPNGPVWTHMVPFGPEWFRLVPNVFFWSLIIPYGTVWSCLVPPGMYILQVGLFFPQPSPTRVHFFPHLLLLFCMLRAPLKEMFLPRYKNWASKVR